MALKVPTVRGTWNMLKKGAVTGAIGGACVGFGMRIGGPIGAIIASAIGSAATGDDFIVKNATMDAVAIMLLGGGEW